MSMKAKQLLRNAPWSVINMCYMPNYKSRASRETADAVIGLCAILN